jgi:hypothetical protein
MVIVAPKVSIWSPSGAACDCCCHETCTSLYQQFGTGVRLSELTAVAKLVSMMAQIRCPRREVMRSSSLMIRWFHLHWAVIYPHLCLIQLRDENNLPITRARELMESGWAGRNRAKPPF